MLDMPKHGVYIKKNDNTLESYMIVDYDNEKEFQEDTMKYFFNLIHKKMIKGNYEYESWVEVLYMINDKIIYKYDIGKIYE